MGARVVKVTESAAVDVTDRFAARIRYIQNNPRSADAWEALLREAGAVGAWVIVKSGNETGILSSVDPINGVVTMRGWGSTPRGNVTRMGPRWAETIRVATAGPG